MRLTQGIAALLLTATLAGCGHDVAPTAAALDHLPAATPAPTVTTGLAESTAAAPADDAVTLAAPEATSAPAALADVLKEDAPSATSVQDPWRPYAFGVSDTDHDAVTLTWRTAEACRATIYFGKDSGFATHGYTNALAVNDERTSHTVRVTGLSRFTKYHFVVVSLGPVGLQVPSYAVTHRTALLF